MEPIIEIHGLNARQQALADILWDFDEWEDVEQFMSMLPAKQRKECESIIELMRIELVDTYRKGMGLTDTPEADRVISKFRLTR